MIDHSPKMLHFAPFLPHFPSYRHNWGGGVLGSLVPFFFAPTLLRTQIRILLSPHVDLQIEVLDTTNVDMSSSSLL